jgi:CubicO group peptidase (beta-lactamase class C family)
MRKQEINTGVMLLRDDLAPVGTLFHDIVRSRPEHRLGFAAYHRGERVALLDSHGHGDAPLTLYSAVKGALAIAVGVLVQDGRLALDAPVAQYWPEFASAGKDAVTVAQLLSHQAGLINVEGGFGLDELIAHDPLAERLAAQRPWWTPGTRHGYHVLTFGTLLDELVRGVTGADIASLFQDRVARPRDIDLQILITESTEARSLSTHPPEQGLFADTPIPENGPLWTAFNLFTDFPSPAQLADIPAIRTGGPAGMAGAATADGLARLYASTTETVDGRAPLFEPPVLAELTATRAFGPDLVLPVKTGFACGFEVSPHHGQGSAEDWFGHGGLGGSRGSCLPRARTSFGFTTDHMPPAGGRDPAESALRSAVLACLRKR